MEREIYKEIVWTIIVGFLIGIGFDIYSIFKAVGIFFITRGI